MTARFLAHWFVLIGFVAALPSCALERLARPAPMRDGPIVEVVAPASESIAASGGAMALTANPVPTTEAVPAASATSVRRPPKASEELPDELERAPRAAAAAGPQGSEVVDGVDVEGAEESDEGEEGAAEESGADDLEAESHAVAESSVEAGKRYTSDVDDSQLEKLWRETPESLGALSIGFTDAGRLVNARQFPAGQNWTLTDPSHAWTTEETIAYLSTAIDTIAARFAGTPPLRVNHLSSREGGWLRPHRSHQAGRDVDLGFYYLPGGPDRGAWAVKNNFDLPRNWALVRSLITATDLQFVLVDRKIIKNLFDYALSIGEDRAWLDSVFHAGRDSLVQHARRHRDHFHVRFYNPRAQELGRRVQPLMKNRPDQNILVHRVRSGDCLGSIANRYGSTVAAIRKANGIKGNMIRVGRTLLVPLRGPCTQCPQPPEIVVPPRRLPPFDPSLIACLARGV